MRKAEEPETDSRCLEVAASEKMSAGWAEEMVWVWRYCFDWRGG